MDENKKEQYAKSACIYGTAVGPSSLYPKDMNVVVTLGDVFTYYEAYGLSISSGLHLGLKLIKTSIIAFVCSIPPIKKYLFRKYLILD